MIMDGVFSKWPSTMRKICAGPGMASAYKDRILEFAIRWDGDEIADDLLVLDTNGASAAPEIIREGGKTYTLTFTEENIQDVFAVNTGQPAHSRPSNEIALRFFLEFDSFLVPGVEAFAKPRRQGYRGATEFLQVWMPERLAPDDTHK